MKMRLAVSEKRRQEIEEALTACGIEIDEDSDLTLSESGKSSGRLLVRDAVSGERVPLPVDDIVYIEAFGHEMEVHTRQRSYRLTERLYKLLDTLGPERFLRISNSVIIAKDKISSISPTLSMKFVLTMQNGKKVDVTRSYYYIFKDSIGI